MDTDEVRQLAQAAFDSEAGHAIRAREARWLLVIDMAGNPEAAGHAMDGIARFARWRRRTGDRSPRGTGRRRGTTAHRERQPTGVHPMHRRRRRSSGSRPLPPREGRRDRTGHRRADRGHRTDQAARTRASRRQLLAEVTGARRRRRGVINEGMVLRLSILAVLMSIAIAVPASASSRYVGYVGGDGRAFHMLGQGGLHKLVLTDAEFSNRRYRVCIRGGAGRINRCFRRRLRTGFSEVNVSLLVNDRGGPGRYLVRWYVSGRAVASWRFRLRPEGV